MPPEESGESLASNARDENIGSLLYKRILEKFREGNPSPPKRRHLDYLTPDLPEARTF